MGDIDLLENDALKVDRLLLLAHNAANERLQNTTNEQEYAAELAEISGEALVAAQQASDEAEADYASFEGLGFSAAKVAANRNRQVAQTHLQTAKVHKEQADTALEAANQRVDEMLALVMRIERVASQTLTLDALIGSHSDLFVQLGVELPDNHVDTVNPPVVEYEYYYYDDDADEVSAPTVVSDIVASPPPSPTPAPLSIADELQDIIDREMEEVEQEMWQHPVFAAAVALLGATLLCCCVRKMFCRSSHRAQTAGADRMEDEHDDDDDDEDDYTDGKFDDIELQERPSHNGRNGGGSRSARQMERDSLNDECSSTRAHRSNGRKKNGAVRIP